MKSVVCKQRHRKQGMKLPEKAAWLEENREERQTQQKQDTDASRPDSSIVDSTLVFLL